MARGGVLFGGAGIMTRHSYGRLINQCKFKGDKAEAGKFLMLCRKKAGKNGSLVISAFNLGISDRQMFRWGLSDDKYYINFVNGKAPTVLQLDVL